MEQYSDLPILQIFMRKNAAGLGSGHRGGWSGLLGGAGHKGGSGHRGSSGHRGGSGYRGGRGVRAQGRFRGIPIRLPWHQYGSPHSTSLQSTDCWRAFPHSMLQLNDTGAQTPNSGVSGKNRARFFFVFSPSAGHERERAGTCGDERGQAGTSAHCPNPNL